MGFYRSGFQSQPPSTSSRRLDDEDDMAMTFDDMESENFSKFLSFIELFERDYYDLSRAITMLLGLDVTESLGESGKPVKFKDFAFSAVNKVMDVVQSINVKDVKENEESEKEESE